MLSFLYFARSKANFIMENNKVDQQSLEEGSKTKVAFGVIILVIGFLSPLLIPFVTQSSLSTAWKTTISGLLALGVPELFMIVAIAVMGKSGYNKIKSSVLQFFKRNGPPMTVSKTRYTFGLVMFSIVILFGVVLPYILNHLVYLQEHLIKVTLISDFILISSLWILGGDFWDKLRSIYVYNSRAVLIEKNENDEKGN